MVPRKEMRPHIAPEFLTLELMVGFHHWYGRCSQLIDAWLNSAEHFLDANPWTKWYPPGFFCSHLVRFFWSSNQTRKWWSFMRFSKAYVSSVALIQGATWNGFWSCWKKSFATMNSEKYQLSSKQFKGLFGCQITESWLSCDWEWILMCKSSKI